MGDELVLVVNADVVLEVDDEATLEMKEVDAFDIFADMVD